VVASETVNRIGASYPTAPRRLTPTPSVFATIACPPITRLVSAATGETPVTATAAARATPPSRWRLFRTPNRPSLLESVWPAIPVVPLEVGNQCLNPPPISRCAAGGCASRSPLDAPAAPGPVRRHRPHTPHPAAPAGCGLALPDPRAG